MTAQKDPNDKYIEYKVDLHCNENYSPDEAKTHKDELLEKFCDNHPSSPMCKVFDV